MYEAFPIIVFIFMLFLSITWKHNDALNTTLKIICILLTIWSGLEALDRLNILDVYKDAPIRISNESSIPVSKTAR